MNFKSWARFSVLVVGAWASFSTIGQAAEAVAEIRYSTGPGTVSTTEGGAVRAVTKGDKVYSGDVVSTGPSTYINLKFIDGSFVLIRPKSRFQIEDFQLMGTAARGAAEPSKPAASTAQD